MNGLVRWCVGITLLVWGLGSSTVTAQTSTGAICVATFADTNANGVRDGDEGLLEGVNVNLATGGAIIATHITTADETQYCFENLLRGEYTVTFTDAPTYRTTTPNQGAFALDSGERLAIDAFGAVPVPLDTLRDRLVAEYEANQTDEPLDTATRLMLATVGSMLIMLIMVGVGVVVMSIATRQRKMSVRPPEHIQPPQR